MRPKLSEWAAWALQRIDPQDEKVSRAVIRFFSDFVTDQERADWKRRDAAYGLARYGKNARSAIPALRKALQDENPTVRIAAAQGLATIGADVKDAVPMLIRACRDRDVREGNRYFPDSNGEAAEALGVIGPTAKEALPVLTQALNDKDLILPGRIQVPLALVRIDPKGRTRVAIAALERLVKDDYIQGAVDAAEALVKVGSKAVPILIQMLNDERRGRRRAAASALGDLGREAESAFPTLRRVRSDHRATVRRAVVEACGKIDAASTRDILLEALHDPAWSVREAAIRALAKEGKPDNEVATALVAMLNDKDADVQDAAKEVLKGVDPKAADKP